MDTWSLIAASYLCNLCETHACNKEFVTALPSAQILLGKHNILNLLFLNPHQIEFLEVCPEFALSDLNGKVVKDKDM